MGNDSTELCTKCSVMTTWNLNAESALNTYPQLSVYSGPYKLVSSHIKGVFWLCWFSGFTLHGCYVRLESQREFGDHDQDDQVLRTKIRSCTKMYCSSPFPGYKKGSFHLILRPGHCSLIFGGENHQFCTIIFVKTHASVP